MTLRLSESPVARRSRAFLRRWNGGSFRSYLESRKLSPGGEVALVDLEGTALARFRGSRESISTLAEQGRLEIGEPAVVVLVGDLKSLEPDLLQTVTLLVMTVDDFGQEVDEITHHALERYRELSLLYEFSEKASSATALAEVMDVILREAAAVVRAAGASLVTLDSDRGEQRVLASVGIVPEVSKEAIERVVMSTKTLVGSSWDTLAEVQGEAWEGSLACLPLRTSERIVGVLVVAARPGRQLLPQDQRLLGAFSSLAAMRIEQAWLVEANARKRELAAIGQVASGIVHDFKNPLTAVRGFAEMIAMPHIPVQDHAVLAEQIIDNSDRIWAMVEEILHLARGDQASLERVQTSGEELQKRYAQSLRHIAPSRITLRVELDRLGAITVDVGKLERVLVNLVRNACEAMLSTGTVEVLGLPNYPEEQSITLVVQDNGPGITPNLQHTLFDPFVTAGKHGGTGLGLAIVKKIVEEHQGSVCVEPVLPHGARFLITLPRKPLQNEAVA